MSLNVRQDSVATSLAWATFCVSLLVALSAALEGFFRYGERWRTFRRTGEALKAQGWQFIELGGAYAQARNHVAAFPGFVTQVEALVQQDIETFMAQAAQPQAQTGLQEDDRRDTSPGANKRAAGSCRDRGRRRRYWNRNRAWAARSQASGFGLDPPAWIDMGSPMMPHGRRWFVSLRRCPHHGRSDERGKGSPHSSNHALSRGEVAS